MSLQKTDFLGKSCGKNNKLMSTNNNSAMSLSSLSANNICNNCGKQPVVNRVVENGFVKTFCERCCQATDKEAQKLLNEYLKKLDSVPRSEADKVFDEKIDYAVDAIFWLKEYMKEFGKCKECVRRKLKYQDERATCTLYCADKQKQWE